MLRELLNAGHIKADVVGLAIVVPGDNLDDIRVDLVDGLLPAVVPERVTLLYPAVTAKALELPRGNSCSSVSSLSL